YAQLESWLSATSATNDSCACVPGSPTRLQSPKCGNGNSPLDKTGASRLLTAVLAELATKTTAVRIMVDRFIEDLNALE
ncbi:hypothetical protein, partial [Nocardia cyriacigeorgica]|uniref:hypothetical protein n=1 Tax=Nocardia cyriacigeorgica TaxID=135487 RepID=UPI002457B2A4